MNSSFIGRKTNFPERDGEKKERGEGVEAKSFLVSPPPLKPHFSFHSPYSLRQMRKYQIHLQMG